VEGAADLLVEQGVAGEVADGVVGPDGDLAHDAGAWVLVEHGEEEVLVLGGAGVDHAASLEDEADALDLAPVVNGGEGVVDVAVGPLRAAEDLAVGEVLRAGAVDPDRTGRVDVDGQVGAVVVVGRGRGEAQGAGGLEEGPDAFLALVDGPPRRDGVGQVEQPCLEHEAFVLAEGHLGVLGGGLGGEQGAAPAERPLGAPLEETHRNRAAGEAGRGQPVRGDGRGPLGVPLGPEDDAGVDGLDGVAVEGRAVFELGLLGGLHEDVVERFAGGFPEGVGPGPQGALVDGLDQGEADGVGLDHHQVAGLEPGRIGDEHFGESVEPRVTHGHLGAGR
jgi:hypothetical protein